MNKKFNPMFFLLLALVIDGCGKNIPSSPAAPGETVLRINAGGPQYTDIQGHVWLADADFTGGGEFSAPNTIANTSDQTLYQTERNTTVASGSFTYNLPVNPGTYQVTLKFAEIYGGVTGADQRVFDASINGLTVLTDLDIYAQAGPNNAIDKVFRDVKPVNGVISVQIGPASVNNPKISAIEVIPQDSSSVCSGTLGDNSIGSSIGVTLENPEYPLFEPQYFTDGSIAFGAQAVTVTTTISVADLRLYTTYSGLDQVRGGIYTNGFGHPENLIAQTAPVNLLNSAWTSIPFGSPSPILVPGTYWMAVLFPTTPLSLGVATANLSTTSHNFFGQYGGELYISVGVPWGPLPNPVPSAFGVAVPVNFSLYMDTCQ